MLFDLAENRLFEVLVVVSIAKTVEGRAVLVQIMANKMKRINGVHLFLNRVNVYFLQA